MQRGRFPAFQPMRNSKMTTRSRINFQTIRSPSRVFTAAVYCSIASCAPGRLRSLRPVSLGHRIEGRSLHGIILISLSALLRLRQGHQECRGKRSRHHQIYNCRQDEDQAQLPGGEADGAEDGEEPQECLDQCIEGLRLPNHPSLPLFLLAGYSDRAGVLENMSQGRPGHVNDKVHQHEHA